MSKNYLGLVLCILLVGCSPNKELVDNSRNGMKVNIILLDPKLIMFLIKMAIC